MNKKQTILDKINKNHRKNIEKLTKLEANVH